MTNSPKTSIIIPVFNSKYIGECLDSCVIQTVGLENLEIIVVNDASTDDTKQRLDQLSKKYPFTLINLKENVGPAAARNAGLAAAKGQYIAFLDSDDMMKPDKIEKQLDFYQKYPSIDIVISGIAEIDGNDVNIRELIRPFPANPKTQVELLFLDNLHTITSTLFFARTALKSSGMMNPRLLNLEDMDFALRLLQHSTMYYYPESLTIRRVLSSGLSQSVSEDLFLESRKDFCISAMEMYPYLSKIKKKYWSLNYARLGRILQRQGCGARARHFYCRSLTQQFNLIGLLGFILSFSSSKIQRRIAGKVWKRT